MKVQLYCIVRIHVVYLKEVDLFASFMEKKRTVFFCIIFPVPLLLRALRNRSDHIDISSTQDRSSKRSRRLTKVQKLGFFRKWIPIRRVHNCKR
ncbi:hypothetical protein Godav_018518 [Gossypium davidsonii]|uniref:Ycf15 n=1 Tax=Gossypium davidsonii TaxID=34287 RepID=A0A7J8QY02_GOSDV|nr:hypothetical protein [Gossypium davidsonii]